MKSKEVGNLPWSCETALQEGYYLALQIRVNVISPGPIETPIFSVGKGEENSERVKTNLVRTMGNPDETSKAVSFLASDESSFITGIELFVDGGIAQI